MIIKPIYDLTFTNTVWGFSSSKADGMGPGQSTSLFHQSELSHN